MISKQSPKALIYHVAMLLLSVWLLGLMGWPSHTAFSQESPNLPRNGSPHTRYRQLDDRSLLETSIVSFAQKSANTPSNAATAFSVDLISAVHIADSSYYEELNQRFASYDAVLFEMVGDGTKRSPEELASRPRSAVGGFQRGLQNLLGLTFQLEGIRYDAPNFVHADMSTEAFSEAQAEQGENLLTLVKRAAAQTEGQPADGANGLTMVDLFRVLSSPAMKDELKRIIAPQLASADGLIQQIESTKGSVILSGRNQVVMEKLSEVRAEGKQHVAVFYGAAHMSGIADLIKNDLDLEQGKSEWLTAWEIPLAPTPQTPLNAK